MQQITDLMCPVCMLDLKPGMTLKQHLTTHSKQTVINALVKLSHNEETIPKAQQHSQQSQNDEHLTDAITLNHQQSSVPQLTTPYINQVALSSPIHPPNNMGNHFFMYQQSMSTSSPHHHHHHHQHQSNVSPLSFNPFAQQQYFVPAVYNPQMMPYFYQQQQLIMSSNGMPPNIRALPFEISTTTSSIENSRVASDLLPKSKETDEKDDSENKIEEKTDENIEENRIEISEIQIKDCDEYNSIKTKEVILEDEEEEGSNVVEDSSNNSYKQQAERNEEINFSHSNNEAEQHDDNELQLNTDTDAHYNRNNLVVHEEEEEECVETLVSPNSAWEFGQDLNKACQTQNSSNLSPGSNHDQVLNNEIRPDYFFVDQTNDISSNNVYSTEDHHQTYEQAEPIYTSANIINNTEGLEFMSMDEIEGMQVIIGEFSNSSFIPPSSVENNYETVQQQQQQDNPPILMTISNVTETHHHKNESKIELLEHSILENSVEDNSVENVNNIRSDEKMPARGELSGQESLGSTSDVTWNHIQQYQEQNNAVSYENNSWDSNEDYNIEEKERKSDISTVNVAAFKGELKESEGNKSSSPSSITTTSLDVNRKKVKKLVIKPKSLIKEAPSQTATSDSSSSSSNVVFTNRLKLESTNVEPDADDVGLLDNKDGIKAEETKSVINVCRTCNQIYKTKKELRIHTRDVHQPRRVRTTKCQICDEVFDMEHKFNEHLKIHPLECRMCGKLFYRRQGLKLHTARHLGIKPFKCDLCDKAFLVKQKLEEHRNCHTGNSPIKCSMCSETFKRHSNLVQHRNKHHFMIKRKIKDYICVCGEVFHSKKKLAWHKEIHDSKPKACTQCSEKFIHKASLTRHMRRAHNAEYLPDNRNPASTNTECPVCKGIYLKSSLDAHLKTHTSQKPFNCSVCNKEFTTKWNLKLHKWTHANRTQKPFKCELCKAAFIRESDYTSHMNSHKSLRPYTCNYCGAQFIRKYNCQRHVKEHENEKTYNCTVCGKTFHRSYYLKDHMRVHSGDRPYSCHICGKTSTTKSNHNKHVQIHHAREPASGKKVDKTKIMERKRPSSSMYRPKSRSDSSGRRSRSEDPDLCSGGRVVMSSDEDLTTSVKQQQDLRQRLQDEAALYKKRLETYKQAQQNQAALVSRLQAKVLQYKQKCAHLETQMIEYSDQPSSTSLKLYPNNSSTSVSALEQAQLHLKELNREERITDLDTALERLLEERKKSDKLIQLNKLLRDQLEESHNTNETLTADLQKLTNDFENLREEMITKDEEWKDEEEAFNDYYSTEHNRLLNLWRDVVDVKRHFTEMQSVTEKDMDKLKLEISEMGREMLMACTRMDSNVFSENLLGVNIKQQQLISSDSADFHKIETELESLKSEKLNYETNLQQKDEKIQQLVNDMQLLEEKCMESDQNYAEANKLQEEIEILENALKNIAQALIQDADTKETEILLQTTHLHLSTTPTQPYQKRSGRSLMATPAAFAESTVSAVQAGLNKYQSYIHELQVKLQSNKEQLLLVRKQYENSENNVAVLEKRTKELTVKLDASHAKCSQFVQEQETLRKTVESLKNDKIQLERTKNELNVLLDSLNQEHAKLVKNNSKLQKELDSLFQEKIFMQGEIERLNQDGDVREMNLRGEEDRCSRIREELLTVREELHKMILAHDLLEQQKLESDNLLSNLEKTKLSYEMQLNKLLGESSNAQDSLVRKETLAINLESDKKKLQEDFRKLEDSKMALQIQCNDQQNDIQSLKKELLQTEQQKLDLESDKVSLSEKCKFFEIDKEKIEMELNQIIRERNDLSNQLTVMVRKKDALNEELTRSKQKLDQFNETNARINRNLEDLVKESEAKQAQIDGMDKEIQRVQELFAALRSEKESLEAVLFDTQTNLEASNDKKVQLEGELQVVFKKLEQTNGQVIKLTKELEKTEKKCAETKSSLLQQAGNKDVEFKHSMDKLKQHNEENVKKLTEEREKIRNCLEKRLQQTMQQLENEKTLEIQQFTDRIESLQNHIDHLCQQHEELMLRAENDKQQALLIAHHDQKALNDKFESTRRELENERETLERLKREANSRYEQDRVIINQLKDDLNKFKGKLEATKNRSEEENRILQQKVEEIRVERDNAQNEVENLKVQLHLCEDKSESLSNLLHETTRKLKEAENHSESLRKELTDVRRLLTDSNFEKEKYHNSNKELRDHVKRTESEKREQNRQLEDAYQKIKNLEEGKKSLENERVTLQNQIRDLEKEQIQIEHKAENLHEELKRSQSVTNQQQQEEKELQAKLLNECEERERTHQELHQLRKQMSELERNLTETRQELNKTRSHYAQLEEQWHVREQDLLIHLEDGRVKEKRLEDQKHNLEVCLVDATQQIQELKAKLGGAESRVRSLETQLAQFECSKREMEQKLFSVVSTLRRIAGIQLDGSVSVPYRLLSPSRRWSPARNHEDHNKDGIVDVDPEIVRKGVRNLMQQVAQIERERDDYKTQVLTVKKQLQESQDTQNKGDHKLTKILQSVRTLQEEKGILEATVGQKMLEVKSQNEALIKKTEEVKLMREKVIALELSLSGESDQKRQYEDKIEKLKAALNRIELEKRNLQEEISRTENRSTKLELQRMSAEGDLQRLQMMLQEKDANIQKLQEKCDHHGKTVASLEERCISLKSTIDQLNCSLEKSSNGESELKSEVQRLQRNLMENMSSQHTDSERLKQMQKLLANTENDRRILSERFETTQNNLAEMRRNNQILQDQITRLNNDLANNEVQKSALESQLRINSQWPPQSDTSPLSSNHHEEELKMQLHSVQKERNELRSKVDSINNKLRQLEAENRNLERQVATNKSSSVSRKNYDHPGKSSFVENHPSSEIHRHERFDKPDYHHHRVVEKYELDSSINEYERYEQENRELKLKIAKLEAELAEKDAELARGRSHRTTLDSKFDRAEIERYRAAQLQAERLLEAREQSHRQQIARLENQIKLLREQLNEEIKRRQQYVLRSTKAGREMQQLRQALGDSLRTVSQDPSLDALLLEHEARKLDNTLTTTTSLPPALSGLSSSSSYLRSMTPQPK